MKHPRFPLRVARIAAAVLIASLAPLTAHLMARAAEPTAPAPASNPKAGLPAGLPEGWNNKIPLPPGATIVTVGNPTGSIRNVEFKVPGDYNGLIEFYTTELKKAGFKVGLPVKSAARKAFNITFEETDTLNSISFYPDDKDPSKFDLRVTYVPTNLRKAKPGAAISPGMVPNPMY